MDPTGDDGLTEGERAEIAAADAEKTDKSDVQTKDDKGSQQEETVAADAPEEKNDASAKVDPAVAALTAVGERITQGLDALTQAQRKEETKEEAKPRDFDAEKRSLREQLDKGEIDGDEYDLRREKILEDQADFRAEQKINARLAAEREANSQANWERDVKRFRNDPSNSKLYDSPIRNAAFNAAVHSVAKEMPQGSNNEWLREARNRVYADYGFPIEGAAEAAKKEKTEIQKDQQARDKKAGDRPNPSVTDVPAAGVDVPNDTPDWMRNLDNMDISDQEDALARLPADKVAAYLEQAPGGLKDNPRRA